MLVHGYQDVTVAEYHHHAGSDLDPAAFERAWNGWLAALAD
jgi:hypothetical protein